MNLHRSPPPSPSLSFDRCQCRTQGAPPDAKDGEGETDIVAAPSLRFVVKVSDTDAEEEDIDKMEMNIGLFPHN